MPDEPNNRKMDELLKSYANKRREEAGAPLEMHPATRKLLQDEVAKLRPEPSAQRDSFSAWLSRLMPKIVIVGSLAVVAIAMIVLLKPSAPAPPQLAQNHQARDVARAPQGTTAAETTPVDRLKGAGTFGVPKEEERARAEPPQTKLSLTAPVPATDGTRLAAGDHLADADKQEAKLADDLSSTLGDKTDSLAKELSSAKLEAPGLRMEVTNTAMSRTPTAPLTSVPPASVPPPVAGSINGYYSEGLAGSGQALPASSSRRQQFARVNMSNVSKDARSDSISSSIGNVLVNFQIEQTGDRVRIVDADGSIYEGKVAVAEPRSEQVAVAREAGSGTEKLKEAGGRESQSNGLALGQTVSFRVTGTNRSMNQIVVFEGNLVPDTNVVAQTPGRSRSGTQPQKVSGEASLFNVRIQGRARVGTANEIEIDAAPSR